MQRARLWVAVLAVGLTALGATPARAAPIFWASVSITEPSQLHYTIPAGSTGVNVPQASGHMFGFTGANAYQTVSVNWQIDLIERLRNGDSPNGIGADGKTENVTSDGRGDWSSLTLNLSGNVGLTQGDYRTTATTEVFETNTSNGKLVEAIKDFDVRF